MDELGEGGLPGLDDLAGDAVGVDEHRAAPDEEVGDGRLPDPIPPVSASMTTRTGS